MSRDDTTEKIRVGRQLLRLLGLFRPYWWMALGGIVLLVVTVVGELAVPMFIGWVVDVFRAEQSGEAAPRSHVIGALRDGIAATFSIDPSSVMHLTILTLAAVALRDITRFTGNLLRLSMAQWVTGDLRCRLFEKVQALGFDYHDRTSTGEVISRCTRDVDRVRRFVSFPIFGILQTSLFIGGALVIVGAHSLWLLIVPGILLVATLTLIFVSSIRLGRLWKEASDRYARVTRILRDAIAGVRVIKAFARERDQIERFDDSSQSYVDQAVTAGNFWSTRLPLAGFIFGTSIPITVLLGGWLILRGAEGGPATAVTVGAIVTSVLYLNDIYRRVRQTGHFIESAQSAAASAHNIYKIVDAGETVHNPPSPKPLPTQPGRLAFEDVSFAYDNEGSGIDDIDLAIEPGQRVAIVGPTGSGKSTLIGLIPRFRDPTRGRVLMDGVDLRRLDLRDIRSQVGVVFQETFLFSASIRENIALGNPDADDELIERSARAAAAHNFIVELDEGYDTMVGEWGVTLSGGQRQRVAIARALAMEPSVLILDDATSSVDSRTESGIRKALAELPRSMTVINITHRMTSLRHYDLIVVMDRGRIVERGAHDELVDAGGLYSKMYASQVEGVAL